MGAKSGGDAHAVWKQGTRRAYYYEFVFERVALGCLLPTPVADTAVRWIEDDTFIHCHTCGSLVLQSQNDHVVSRSN